MEKLYYEHPYLAECECTVLSVRKNGKYTEIITDKTIFYPEGGGQRGDIGFIGDYAVYDTKKGENGESVLLADSSSNIAEGEICIQKIDFPHRYTHMVFHTAQHLISGTLFTAFNIGTTAVHLGDDYITIETDRREISSEVIEELERLVNKRIRESHPVVCYTIPHSDAEKLGLRRSIKVNTDVRIVEIEGVDKIACGGVHVKNTSEIGNILYVKYEIIRDHARLYFKAGESALLFARTGLNLINSVKNLLGTGEDDILKKIENLTETVSALKHENASLSENLAKNLLESRVKDGKAIIETELDVSCFLRPLEKYEDLKLFVYNDKNWLTFLKGRFGNISFNDIKEGFFQSAEAKGGGRDGIYRGSYANSEGLKLFLQRFGTDEGVQQGR